MESTAIKDYLKQMETQIKAESLQDQQDARQFITVNKRSSDMPIFAKKIEQDEDELAWNSYRSGNNIGPAVEYSDLITFGEVRKRGLPHFKDLQDRVMSSQLTKHQGEKQRISSFNGNPWMPVDANITLSTGLKNAIVNEIQANHNSVASDRHSGFTTVTKTQLIPVTFTVPEQHSPTSPTSSIIAPAFSTSKPINRLRIGENLQTAAAQNPASSRSRNGYYHQKIAAKEVLNHRRSYDEKDLYHSHAHKLKPPLLKIAYVSSYVIGLCVLLLAF